MTLDVKRQGGSLRHFRPAELWLGDLAAGSMDLSRLKRSALWRGRSSPGHITGNAAEVRVNVQSPTGGLKVQLQNETGRAFAGFGAEDCEPIVEDALDAPVRWRGSGDVRSLSGKIVALQFSFSPEDKLYS